MGRTEHVPTSQDYPDSIMRRVTFEAGGGLGWKISALTTVREAPAPLKIVVVPGAPCWAEYWAPVLAALPQDREMIVVDRPGFAASEPATCVPDIRLQALALSPLLQATARRSPRCWRPRTPSRWRAWCCCRASSARPGRPHAG
jgi:pimeloyl-ACP methyl ester carboxylesterase